MPMSKSAYEQVLGRKLSDAEYGKLSGAATQDRPVVEADLYKPSGINASAPNTSLKKSAYATSHPIHSGIGGETFGGGSALGGGQSMIEANTTGSRATVHDKLGGTGGGGYGYGTTNTPSSAAYLDKMPTKPSTQFNSDDAPKKTWSETSVGDKPIFPKNNGKASGTPLQKLVRAPIDGEGDTRVKSVMAAPASAVYGPAPKAGAPYAGGTLPNVPVTAPSFAAGATNTPTKTPVHSQVAPLIDAAGEEVTDDVTDMWNLIIGEERKKHGL
jgi:hypothetical protein